MEESAALNIEHTETHDRNFAEPCALFHGRFGLRFGDTPSAFSRIEA
jgi:hypothetical protein